MVYLLLALYTLGQTICPRFIDINLRAPDPCSMTKNKVTKNLKSLALFLQLEIKIEIFEIFAFYTLSVTLSKKKQGNRQKKIFIH